MTSFRYYSRSKSKCPPWPSISVVRQSTPQVSVEAHVKGLNCEAILCQKYGCQKTATHLFRTREGLIAVYCECHAKAEAQHLGIELPTAVTKRLDAELW
jgi:hypothetical protein